MRCSESPLATLAAKPEPPTRTQPATTSSSALSQVIYAPGTSWASSPEHRIRPGSCAPRGLDHDTGIPSKPTMPSQFASKEATASGTLKRIRGEMDVKPTLRDKGSP